MPVPGFAHGVTSASYWMSHLRDAQTKTVAQTDATQTASASASQSADVDSGNSFWDNVLDVVNPLQHLPVVGTIYRAATGDRIGDVEKVAGDTLYGGPIGLVTSLADVAFEKLTGKDFGDTVMAFVGLDGKSNGATMLAANSRKQNPNAAGLAAEKPLVAMAAPLQLASTTPIIAAQAAPAIAPGPAKTARDASAPTGSSSVVDISANTDALLQALARNGVTGNMQAQALDAYKRTMQLNAGSSAPLAN
jgi:hypothetical protein